MSMTAMIVANTALSAAALVLLAVVASLPRRLSEPGPAVSERTLRKIRVDAQMVAAPFRV